jgi:tRNA uridine 5-carbamoylmethylation protein Kti12
MAITIVIGSPCSGKSTWVKNELKDNDVIVDYDELAKAFGSRIQHSSKGSIRTVALTARKEAIKRILNGIDDDAFIIHTNPSDEAIDSYLEANANFVLINPGKEACLQRAESRPEGTKEAIEKWFNNPPSIIDELGLQPIKTESSDLKNLQNLLKERELLKILNLRLEGKS